MQANSIHIHKIYGGPNLSFWFCSELLSLRVQKMSLVN